MQTKVKSIRISKAQLDFLLRCGNIQIALESALELTKNVSKIKLQHHEKKEKYDFVVRFRTREKPLSNESIRKRINYCMENKTKIDFKKEIAELEKTVNYGYAAIMNTAKTSPDGTHYIEKKGF